MARDCGTGLYAASVRGKAIACSSTVAKCRCTSKNPSDGNARFQLRTLGTPAKSRPHVRGAHDCELGGHFSDNTRIIYGCALGCAQL